MSRYICRKHARTANYFSSASEGPPVPENEKRSRSPELHSEAALDMEQDEVVSLLLVSTGTRWQSIIPTYS